MLKFTIAIGVFRQAYFMFFPLDAFMNCERAPFSMTRIRPDVTYTHTLGRLLRGSHGLRLEEAAAAAAECGV